MELENKEVKITYLSISMQPQKTVVRVSVLTVISANVSQIDGTYEISFDRMFMTSDDPELMQLIREKLALI